MMSTASKDKKKSKPTQSKTTKSKKKKYGDFTIDSTLLQSDDEKESQLELKARLKDKEIQEHQRHNQAMEKIERDKSLWDNKQKELAYKMELWKQYQEMKRSEMQDSQIVAMFPDMKPFIADFDNQG